MVAQTQAPRQGIGSAPQFGMTQWTDLPVAIMRALIDECDLRIPSHRLIYAIMVVHADCRGNIIARARDIAAAAGIPTDTTLRYLRLMRAAGLLSMERIPGSRMSRWHLTALRVGRPAA